jgi:hypothetical protein
LLAEAETADGLCQRQMFLGQLHMSALSEQQEVVDDLEGAADNQRRMDFHSFRLRQNSSDMSAG